MKKCKGNLMETELAEKLCSTGNLQQEKVGRKQDDY
jgi:hypothetical protein